MSDDDETLESEAVVVRPMDEAHMALDNAIQQLKRTVEMATTRAEAEQIADILNTLDVLEEIRESWQNEMMRWQ